MLPPPPVSKRAHLTKNKLMVTGRIEAAKLLSCSLIMHTIERIQFLVFLLTLAHQPQGPVCKSFAFPSE
jgi:hypothetical protein